LLDPTVLYAPITEQLFEAGVRPHYAVNVTGHGWRKLMRHPAELRYVMRSVPPVPAVLEFLQARGGMSARDAYGTFNMGAGFALFVARPDVAATLDVAARAGLAAWHAGDVHSGAKSVMIEPLGLEFTAGDLHLRG
jgi:phosphoribosylformylglycinamidine cyclo-ligase